MTETANLPEVRFYHLESADVASELPMLAEKVIDTGRPSLLLAPDTDSLSTLDTALWSYDPLKFLAHGVAGSEFDKDQPMLLASVDDVLPQGRELLIVADAAAPLDISGYVRVLYMFDGRRDDILSKARADWSAYKKAGHQLSYWQKAQGRWEQKA